MPHSNKSVDSVSRKILKILQIGCNLIAMTVTETEPVFNKQDLSLRTRFGAVIKKLVSDGGIVTDVGAYGKGFWVN